MKTISVCAYTDDPVAALTLAEGGEEVLILRDEKPIARITPAVSVEREGHRPVPTPEAIREHWRNHRPLGEMSPVTGAELVDWARGDQ